VGDKVEVREQSKKMQSIVDALEAVVRRGLPRWFEIEKENFAGVVKGIPEREDITMPVQEQLIVELYSK
jgi:small subunit ribosomal protein S4